MLPARAADYSLRIRSIPAGNVSTYRDIDWHAPRMVGLFLARTHEELPWFRVVRSDGTVPKGERQLELLRRDGVALRGDRVDLDRARYRG